MCFRLTYLMDSETGIGIASQAIFLSHISSRTHKAHLWYLLYLSLISQAEVLCIAVIVDSVYCLLKMI